MRIGVTKLVAWFDFQGITSQLILSFCVHALFMKKALAQIKEVQLMQGGTFVKGCSPRQCIINNVTSIFYCLAHRYWIAFNSWDSFLVFGRENKDVFAMIVIFPWYSSQRQPSWVLISLMCTWLWTPWWDCSYLQWLVHCAHTVWPIQRAPYTHFHGLHDYLRGLTTKEMNWSHTVSLAQN